MITRWHYYLSLPPFPFVRGEVLPATFSLPHLIVFSTLLCLMSSSGLPTSSHLYYIGATMITRWHYCIRLEMDGFTG